VPGPVLQEAPDPSGRRFGRLSIREQQHGESVAHGIAHRLFHEPLREAWLGAALSFDVHEHGRLLAPPFRPHEDVADPSRDGARTRVFLIDIPEPIQIHQINEFRKKGTAEIPQHPRAEQQALDQIIVRHLLRPSFPGHDGKESSSIGNRNYCPPA
jgi:hypothetical protein